MVLGLCTFGAAREEAVLGTKPIGAPDVELPGRLSSILVDFGGSGMSVSTPSARPNEALPFVPENEPAIGVCALLVFVVPEVPSGRLLAIAPPTEEADGAPNPAETNVGLGPM